MNETPSMIASPEMPLEHVQNMAAHYGPRMVLRDKNRPTVRQLKQEVERRWKERGENRESSQDHIDSWATLNRLGYQMATKTPEETNDVDATAFISQEFYDSYLKLSPTFCKQ